MNRRILTYSFVLLLLALLGGCAFWEYNIPLYSFKDDKLTLGDNTYVSTPNEFVLEAVTVGKKIGRASDGFRIYEIVGQNPQNWVVLRGFMFPDSIYRNIKISEVHFKDKPFNEMQLIQGSNVPGVSTKESIIIHEALDCLNTSKSIKAQQSNYQSYELRFLSPELKGIGFFTYCIIDNKKVVYLTKRESPDIWYKAGKKVTDWVISSLKE